jgi:kynurenine formamidase
MCTPAILRTIHDELSRRDVLRTLGGLAVAAAMPPMSAAAQGPARLANSSPGVHDLTHPFGPTLPVFPAFHPVQIRQRFTIAKDGFFANEITFDEHTGTHVDAPIHFVSNGAAVDAMAADRLVAPLAVVSIEARAAKDADTAITVDDLLAWEKQHGRLPPRAFVAMYSGWDARVVDPGRFLNRDAGGTMHTPGFGEEAARFLVSERDIVGAGVDTLSLDRGAADKFVAHLALLGAGKYAVELMANLATVPPSGAMIVVAAPKVQNGSGGPARVLALV